MIYSVGMGCELDASDSRDRKHSEQCSFDAFLQGTTNSTDNIWNKY